MQQRIVLVRPEVAFKPVHVCTEIARVVRNFVLWLRSRFFTSRDLQQPQRKIHAGIDGKRQRSPETRINLHQPVLPFGVHLEFNHGHAVPVERS